MYESYWRLRERPFENIFDDRFFYPSESHQAAILKLRYAVENRRQGALLAGASGLGKTLIVNMLEDALPEQYGPFARVTFPQMPVDQLLAYIAFELTKSQRPSETEATSHSQELSNTPDIQMSVQRIERFLAENTSRGRHAVAVIDEVHLLEDRHALEAIRLLPNFGPNGSPALTMLLVGQTAFLPVLDRTPQLEERLGVKCLLRSFSEEETRRYVEHRLQVAGADYAIFDNEAISAIHYQAHGNPRQINRLCDLALLVGYAEQQEAISAVQVESISQELTTVSPE